MNLLIGLTPFVIFFVFMRFSISIALWGAFAAAFIVCIRDFLRSGILRVLDAGSILLFGMLAFYTGFIQTLSIPAVRFGVDGTLTLIIFITLIIRQPFTMQYAREQVPQDFWHTPLFVRANYMLTWVWAVAFLVTASADAAAAFLPENVSLTACIAVGMVAMIVAFVFTVRYAAQVRKEAGLPHVHWFN